MSTPIPCHVTLIASCGQPDTGYDYPSIREAVAAARGLQGALILGSGGVVRVDALDAHESDDPIWIHRE